jgi:uncharacterized RmlC-like cupin family protein
LRLVRPAERSRATTQTPGLARETAIDARSVGARTLWVGLVRMAPGLVSGVHHHGDSESGIFVIQGQARFQFGPGLKETFDAEAGDFVYVPPHAIHQEANRRTDAPVEMVVVRDRQENIVVAVDVRRTA